MIQNDFVNDSVLLKHIQVVLRNNFSECVERSDNKFNFRCNVCGDSNKSKTKKRGWIVRYKGKLLFRCFNCGASLLAQNWLKEYFPLEYRSFITECLQTKNNEQTHTNKKKSKNNIYDPEKYLKDFRTIKKPHGKIFDLAIEFCYRRKIPEDEWKKWLVCPNISSNQFRNRLIIPVRNKNNEIIYWTGRSLKEGDEPKYRNCKVPVSKATSTIIKRLDSSKPVICVEGYIDSLFIENGLPLFSTNWSQEVDEELKTFNCYYMLDTDSSKETKKRKINLLKQGRKLFNWNSFLKDNNIPNREKWDVNDLFLYMNLDRKFTFKDFKDYFTSNLIDSVLF